MLISVGHWNAVCGTQIHTHAHTLRLIINELNHIKIIKIKSRQNQSNELKLLWIEEIFRKKHPGGWVPVQQIGCIQFIKIIFTIYQQVTLSLFVLFIQYTDWYRKGGHEHFILPIFSPILHFTAELAMNTEIGTFVRLLYERMQSFRHFIN